MKYKLKMTKSHWFNKINNNYIKLKQLFNNFFIMFQAKFFAIL